MSYPTPLSPWFVVQRIGKRGVLEFYHSPVTEPREGEPVELFTQTKSIVMLFQTLQQASRVAEAEAAEVRVLYSKEGAKEFGRG